MLFTMEKNKSLSVLKAAIAIYIVLAPVLSGFMDCSINVYVMFLFSGIFFLMRANSTKQVHLSVVSLCLAVLLLYAVLSFFWVSNKYDHFTYITAIAAMITVFCIVSDYFAESSEEKTDRRIRYMISLGGILCAVLNILYWIIYLVPYGKNTGFSMGIGSSDFLSVLMFLFFIITVSLIKGNSSGKRKLFVFSAILMLFVGIMAKSFLGWAFALIFAACYAVKQKWKRSFVPFSLFAAFLLLIGLILAGSGTNAKNIFTDVFTYGIGSIIGKGGGFWSAKEAFLTGAYGQPEIPGLLSYMCASSGIVGIAVCVAILARNVLQFIKLKTWSCLTAVLLCITVMFVPFTKSLIMLFIMTCIMAYNEKTSELSVRRNFNKKSLKKIVYAISVLVVITAVNLCQGIIRISADSKFNQGKYQEAYELYKLASTVSLTDGESSRKAALSLAKSGYVLNNYEEAITLTKTAQKRDNSNLLNMQTRAFIYSECGMYDLSIGEYATLTSKVLVNDKYNLEFAQTLYKSIAANPRGSAETKVAYEKLIEIAANTEDLDYREKINNIADKALVYTKGELNVENKN